ncbi:MAG: hypothetical protein AB8D52_12455 [Gammaproteobacteria bacterium]
MKTSNNKKFTLVLTFILFFPFATFSIDLFDFGDEDEGVFWKVGTNVYLKHAEQDDASFGKNDHPVELNEEDISKALSLLEITEDKRFGKSEETGPVFSLLQINVLSKNLARGLTKARADQDILFALKKDVDRFLGMKKQQVFVAGRVFYKDGRLNIIIGDYDRARQEGYEAVNDPTHMGIVKYHFNHGWRSKVSKKFRVITAQVDGVETKQINGKLRKEWFVIDLALASKAADMLAKDQKKKELEGKREELRAIFGDDIITRSSARKEKAKSERERRQMRAEMARMRKEMSSGASTQSIEQRLSALEELKNKDLISNDEYQLKRKEILNDI